MNEEHPGRFQAQLEGIRRVAEQAERVHQSHDAARRAAQADKVGLNHAVLKEMSDVETGVRESLKPFVSVRREPQGQRITWIFEWIGIPPRRRASVALDPDRQHLTIRVEQETLETIEYVDLDADKVTAVLMVLADQDKWERPQDPV